MYVVHCKRESYDVYIGRPSKWGNPFEIGRDGTREEVIAKYRRWIRKQPKLLASLPELHGKVLGCWCTPAPCHGDVLLELLDDLDLGVLEIPAEDGQMHQPMNLNLGRRLAVTLQNKGSLLRHILTQQATKAVAGGEPAALYNRLLEQMLLPPPPPAAAVRRELWMGTVGGGRG